MTGGDRARDEFFSEAQEIFETLGRGLLGLDEAQRAGRTEPDLLNDVFRGVHTLKGLAGLFGVSRLTMLSHELEATLDDLRLGRVTFDAATLDLLFRALELFGRLLQEEKDGRGEHASEAGLAELVEELRRRGGASPSQAPGQAYDLDPALLAVLTEYEEHRLRTNVAQGMTLYRLRVEFLLQTIDTALDDLKGLAKPYAEIITYLPTGAGANADSIELDILMAARVPVAELRSALVAVGGELEEVARRRESRAPAARPSVGPPSERGRASELSVPPAAAGPSAPPAAGRGDFAVGKHGEVGSLRSVTQTVRVDIEKLDQLMNVVGELEIVRTGLGALLARMRAAGTAREILTDMQRLERGFERQLDTLQAGILEVRMVPLGQVFDRLARVVRQLGREADKQVNLVITGAETEVDKLIVEELSDPLMHMMRNAIDHGIERQDEREAVGKPSAGTIALNAFQKGNHVVIELEDDGRGIDTAELLQAAVRRGVLTPEEASATSPREALELAFLPGMTTRHDVSEISGRGVGMDVVKTNIAKLGGAVDLFSEPGIGTKVSVTLPITLAILAALVVRVEGQLFAIPLANVQEALVLDGAIVRRVDHRPMATLRGSSLPLCFLGQLFDIDRERAAGSSGAGSLLDHGAPSDPSTEQDSARERTGGLELVGKGTGRLVGVDAERDRRPKERRFVVVATVGTRRLGLVVDGLIGERDIVIKPLGPSLASARGFAGATELGDQRIALVLDVPTLLDEALASASPTGTSTSLGGRSV